MKHLLAIALFCAGLFCLAQAQVPMTGAGKGAPGGAVAYQGPLDIVATPFVAYGTRCLSTAYTGNVLDVWDSATGSTTETLITCSAGGILNQTVNTLAVTCAAGCNAKIVYDQGPHGVNLTAWSNTNSNAAAFTQSCVNGHWCLTFLGSSSEQYRDLASTSTTVSQPFTFSEVWNCTDVGSGEPVLKDGNFFGTQCNTGNVHEMYAGSAFTVTQASGSWHTFQSLWNSNTSKLLVDASLTTGGDVSTGAWGTQDRRLGNNTGSQYFTGTWGESIVWAGDQSASATALHNNQCAYYGSAC